MKNLPFVLWMLLYPLIVALSEYLCYLATNIRHTDTTLRGLTGITEIIIWFYVGYKLYVPNNAKITKHLFQDSKPITKEIKDAIEETSKRIAKNHSKFKSRL